MKMICPVPLPLVGYPLPEGHNEGNEESRYECPPFNHISIYLQMLSQQSLG